MAYLEGDFLGLIVLTLCVEEEWLSPLLDGVLEGVVKLPIIKAIIEIANKIKGTFPVIRPTRLFFLLIIQTMSVIRNAAVLMLHTNNIDRLLKAFNVIPDCT